MIGTAIYKLGEEVGNVGQFGRFAWRSAVTSMQSIAKSDTYPLIWAQMLLIGVYSVPVIMITGAFVGMTLALQAYDQLAGIGLEEHLGVLINISVVKELGPVLAAVMLAGRVGGALTAELGTMKVTEQIDAIESMGTDPVKYLVAPARAGVPAPYAGAHRLRGPARYHRRLVRKRHSPAYQRHGILEFQRIRRRFVGRRLRYHQGFLLRRSHGRYKLLQGF